MATACYRCESDSPFRSYLVTPFYLLIPLRRAVPFNSAYHRFLNECTLVILEMPLSFWSISLVSVSCYGTRDKSDYGVKCNSLFLKLKLKTKAETERRRQRSRMVRNPTVRGKDCKSLYWKKMEDICYWRFSGKFSTSTIMHLLNMHLHWLSWGRSPLRNSSSIWYLSGSPSWHRFRGVTWKGS